MVQRRVAFSVVCLLGLMACGDDDDRADDARDSGTKETRDAAHEPEPVEDAGQADAGEELDECQGFDMEGLLYSPGGDVLPDTCKPFHPTTNNPYAVRCVDAWPHYKTRFPGDDLCILPPPPDKGIQVGVHPQGPDWFAQVSAGDMSGYDDAGENWVLAPGDEVTINFRTGATNPEPHHYYRTYFRMRTGSHHSIITLHEAGAEQEVWLEGQELPGLFDMTSGRLIGILGGEQRPDDSTPVTLEKPEEDEGMYLEWPAQPSILFNMHHFNITEDDIIKETWVNLWWEDDDDETRVTWFMGLDMNQVGGLAVEPGEIADLHYAWDVSSQTRLIRLFGHRHAWTSNFSSWIERAGGDVELIYQSFDWFDMPTYRYDSHVKNPQPSAMTRSDGAASGVLLLEAGDRLHFNCHIEYTDERAITEDAPISPSENGTLRFANEAFKGEMCIAFGNSALGGLGRPSADDTALPDFATAR